MSLIGIIASQNYARIVVPTVTQFLYAGGNAVGGSLKKNFLYNIAADTYTAKTDLAQDAGEHPGGGYYNANVYLFGGGYSNNYAYNYAYSVSGNSWSAKTDMSAGRVDLGTCTYEDYLWAIGGKAVGSNVTKNEVYYYDPVANTWTQKANMPAARGTQGTGVISGKMYVNGGYLNPGNTAQADTYEYDFTTNTWTTKTSSTYNHAKNPGINASDGTFLYAIANTEFTPNNQAEKYDPVTNAWSNITDSTNTLADNNSSYFVNGDGKIFVGSGPVQNATQVYTISTDTWVGGSGTPSTGMTRPLIAGIP